MSTTTSVVIRSAVALPPQQGPGADGVSPILQQNQQVLQVSREQRHFLRDPSMPPVAGILFSEMEAALRDVAKSSRLFFSATLELKGTGAVYITIKEAGARLPLPDGLKGFEIPGFNVSRSISFFIRLAPSAHGDVDLRYDLAAFLCSQGHGIEDSEPCWYALDRNVPLEHVIGWFEGWLGGRPSGKRPSVSPGR